MKIIQEASGGIRDIILGNMQSNVIDAYAKNETPMRLSQGSNAFFSSCPRLVIELLGMALMILVALILVKTGNNQANILPTLGVIIIGLQRLIPTVQIGYANWANIVGNYATLKDAASLISEATYAEQLPCAKIMKMQEALVFRDVSFGYANRKILNSTTFSIPAGSRTGIIGNTGSGKSTILDLLMGLLKPDAGSVLVDGEVIGDANVKSWQSSIAHVPQNIFLIDGTLEQNIALGIRKNNVDQEAMRRSTSVSQLEHLIKSSGHNMDFRVGERGALLSGGERQRIGLARALYKNDFPILILDEATSALDTYTEKAILDRLFALYSKVTIIIVTHHYSILRDCDLLLEVKKGVVTSFDGPKAVNKRLAQGVE